MAVIDTPVDVEAQLSLHHEEAVFLWLQRRTAVQAPHYTPQQFSDLDERLAAHLDGLRTQFDPGFVIAARPLASPTSEDVFVATVLALERPGQLLEPLLQSVAANADTRPGLLSGLGFASPNLLAAGLDLLRTAGTPLARVATVAALAMHRRDPGPELADDIVSESAGVCARALRAAGELGRLDLLPAVQASMSDPRREVQFWAARSACLLGDRDESLDVLADHAAKTGAHQARAFRTVLLALDAKRGHVLLKKIGDSHRGERSRIIGAGYVGDARYVPWLIDRMATPAVARVAAEAFVRITGADFNLLQFESMPPEGHEDGPSDDPDDDSVEVPEDVTLPWPNVDRIRLWWDDQQSRLAQGSRLFLGHGATRERCLAVLKTGLQRERVVAADLLAMTVPGRILFPTSAPAWRQRALLDSPR